MSSFLLRLIPLVLLPAVLQPAGVSRLLPLNESAYQRVLADQRGKVVLVNFWATWCAPCLEEMPMLVQLEASLKQRGFRLVTITVDEKEQEREALQFLQKHRVLEPAYIKRTSSDDAFITAVDAKWSGAVPALFLFDRNGRKIQSFIGETEKKDLEPAIRKLL